MIDNMDNNSKKNKPYLKGVSPVINIEQGEIYDVSYMFRAMYDKQGNIYGLSHMLRAMYDKQERSDYHNEQQFKHQR